MSRWRAASLSLALGAGVLVAALAVIRFLWYPGFYFEVQDAARTLPVLAAVCLVVGPLLTGLVFKPGKKGLRFDLTVIALLQAAALTFGLYRLYVERPVFLVFVMDHFTVVSDRDVDIAAARARGFDKPFTEPGLAAASVPADPAARSRLTQEILVEGKPDIDFRPEFWSPYGEAVDEIRSVAPALGLLRENRPRLVTAIDRLVEDSQVPLDELLFLSALGPRAEYAVVIRKSDGAVQGALEVASRR